MGCGTALTTEQTSSTTREGLTVKCGTNLKSIAKCEVQRSTDSQRIYRVKCSGTFGLYFSSTVIKLLWLSQKHKSVQKYTTTELRDPSFPRLTMFSYTMPVP